MQLNFQRIKISTSDLSKLVSTSRSFSEVLRTLNINPNGNTKYLKRLLVAQNIDFQHFKSQNSGRYEVLPDEEIFKIYDIATKLTSTGRKFRIRAPTVRERYRRKFPEKCAKCGQGTVYNNTPLSLQLDHINGIPNDNRLENLRWLCPNCHSQTDTYGTKNSPIKATYYAPTKCISCGDPVYTTQAKKCHPCGLNQRIVNHRIVFQKTTKNIEEIKRLRSIGTSWKKICKQLHIGKNNIFKIRKEFNLE